MDRANNAIDAGIGIVIFNTKANMIEQSVRITFLATNNVVKYEEVLLALKELKGLEAKHESICSDSWLLVNQISKAFELKEKEMKKYLNEIKEWEAQFKAFKIMQILCNNNAHANTLATLFSIVPKNMKRVVHISTIIKLNIKKKESINELE